MSEALDTALPKDGHWRDGLAYEARDTALEAAFATAREGTVAYRTACLNDGLPESLADEMAAEYHRVQLARVQRRPRSS